VQNSLNPEKKKAYTDLISYVGFDANIVTAKVYL